MSLSFEQYDIDGTEIACERLISQFNPSITGIQPFLFALINQTSDWNTISGTVFAGRFLDEALGVQLDIIGRIVGLPRPFVDGDQITYFQFDNDSQATGWDGTSGWFVENAPTTGTVLANDSTYRQFLYGKIFKNQVTGASVPEQIQFIKLTFGILSSIEPHPTEVMAIYIIVPISTPLSYVILLLSKETNKLVTNNYFVPVANGVRIAGVKLVADEVFGFDGTIAKLGGWDSGKWSITIPGS